ncbi:hypothetical protein KGQ20_23760 [Catenulispora sp. NF23]|uniref:hypothetical protein n=1 Tax=Catenulispora pinistramenti TaxID=2705254 RepID=UPI001BA817F4|nr:hypothetical protein [Catenulispora pinistramenti]MBS2535783.1 hypothetical protein [Catenulispora pinistramenti]
MDDPWDEDVMLGSFETLSPYQRAVVAGLVAHRVGVLAEFPDIDQYFSFAPGYTFLIEDVLRTIDKAATVGQVDAAEAGALKERFEELLGPDGEEYEEPDSWIAANYVNVASMVDYALRTWARPGESQTSGFVVLSSSDAFTAGLHDNEPTLEVVEVARQQADMAAVKDLPEPMTAADYAALKAESASLREAIRAQFQVIIDSEG